MRRDEPLTIEWIAQTRHEIHDTAIEVVQEAVARGGSRLKEVPRPISDIAVVLGSRVVKAPDRLLRGNRGLCTEREILVVQSDDDRHWVQRFTIAHELGHQWLGPKAPEWECNAFSASTLIPDDDVRTFLERRNVTRPATLEEWAHREIRGAVVSHLVRRYGVGYHAMIRALADYGFVAGIAPWTSQAYGDALYESYEYYYRHLDQ